MIVHKIAKAKPVVAVASNDNSLPRLPAPDRLTARNQKELDDAIIRIGCPVGTFVTFDGQTISSLACIHIVAQVQTDYMLVDKRFGRDTVNPYFLVQCDNWTPVSGGWNRWDDLGHCRPITKFEWIKFVEPKIADIQDRCKSFFKDDYQIPRTFTHPHAS